MGELLKLAIVFVLLFPTLIIVTQDLQVFPSLTFSSSRHRGQLPEGVTSMTVATPDSKKIETWRMEPASPSRGVILIFHGNGETNDTGIYAQQSFANAGYLTYQFDYRGIGRSTGWPRESGIYIDSETVLLDIASRENISPGEIILVGNSMGTGPASFLAAKFNSDLLVLLSPYRSIPDLVSEMRFFSLLTRFLWWNFPVEQYVAQLSSTSLIIAHGQLDQIIPFAHGKTVFQSYQGQGESTFLAHEQASHNDLFGRILPELLRQIEKFSGK